MAFGNEVSKTPWSNGSFKSKNSTDPLPARGCGAKDVEKINPTYSFVFQSNDPPLWEQPPKGSEWDRLLIEYLPNRFLNPNQEATSPRCFPKDMDLEVTVAGEKFALGMLLNLMQQRSKRAAERRSLDDIVAEMICDLDDDLLDFLVYLFQS